MVKQQSDANSIKNWLQAKSFMIITAPTPTLAKYSFYSSVKHEITLLLKHFEDKENDEENRHYDDPDFSWHVICVVFSYIH